VFQKHENELFKDSYHPDVGSRFKLGINSVTTKIGIYFQTGSDSQIRVRVQTNSNDNMVSFNLKEIIRI